MPDAVRLRVAAERDKAERARRTGIASFNRPRDHFS